MCFAIWQNLDKQWPQQTATPPPANAFWKYPMRTILLEHSVWLSVESRFWIYAAQAGHRSIHFIILLVSAHSRLIIQNSQWRTAVFIIIIIHIALVAFVRHYHYNIVFVLFAGIAAPVRARANNGKRLTATTATYRFIIHYMAATRCR